MVENNNKISARSEIYESLKDFFYWNSTFIINIFGVFKDIKNYLYLRRSFKKLSKTKIWKDLKLRLDWYGMPYTAINYTKDFFDLDAGSQKRYVVRDFAKLFKEFESYDFWEILTLKIERIDEKDVYALRVWFRPIFYFLSLKNFLLTLILLFLILYVKNII